MVVEIHLMYVYGISDAWETTEKLALSDKASRDVWANADAT